METLLLPLQPFLVAFNKPRAVTTSCAIIYVKMDGGHRLCTTNTTTTTTRGPVLPSAVCPPCSVLTIIKNNPFLVLNETSLS